MPSIVLVQPSPQNQRRYTLLSTWLPVVIGLGVIACESTGTMASTHTSRILRPFFEWLFGRMTDERWGFFHMLIRKGIGHIGGYGALGLCWLRAWLITFANRFSYWNWRLLCSALAVLCTFLTGAADEWHQTFLPGRTGQLSDALLDAAGAAVLILLLMIVWCTRKE